MTDPRPVMGNTGTQDCGRDAPDELSLRVARARSGDSESLSWLYRRLAPALSTQARYLLNGHLRNECDPEDLVSETWAVFLRRVHALRGEPHQLGRVAAAFLGTTLRHKVMTLRCRLLRQGALGTSGGSSILLPFENLVGDGPPSAEIQGFEVRESLQRAVASLDEDEREVVVLRGLEQRPNEEVARLVGLSPAGASRRFQRALLHLRQRIPGSVLDWLVRDRD